MGLALRTIRSELLVAFLLLTAVPATMTHLYYSSRIARLVEADAIRRAEASAAHAANEVARLAGQVHSAEQAVAGLLVIAPLTQRYGTTDLLELYQYRQHLWQHLHNLKWVYPFIMGIHVTHWDGTYYSSLSPNDLSLEDLKRMPWRGQAPGQPSRSLIVPPHPAPYAIYQQAPQRVVTFLRFYNFDGVPDHETVLQIDVDATALDKALSAADVAAGGRAVLVRDDATPIAAVGVSGEADLVDVEAETGVDSLRVVASYPSSLLLRQARSGRNAALVVAAAMMALALGISLWLSSRLARPIRSLTSLMERLGRGDFSVRVPDHPNRDIHILTQSFNRMVDEVNSLMGAVVEKETQRTRAEIEALQAAINPHFLYNTLDVVRGIALAHGDLQVVDMVEALANMFRYSGASEEPMVPLARELGHVRNYVSIQRYRHGDRCSVAYDVPEDLLEYRVPRLLLQPLVENAFAHAFGGLPGQGRVEIGGERREGAIALSVRDNGRGIEADKLASIERRLAAARPPAAGADRAAGGGIGIENVHRRIALTCGAGWGLRLRSEPGAGTVAELLLPALRS